MAPPSINNFLTPVGWSIALKHRLMAPSFEDFYCDFTVFHMIYCNAKLEIFSLTQLNYWRNSIKHGFSYSLNIKGNR